MSNKLKRRDFIKIAVGAGATTGLSPKVRRVLLEPFVTPPEEALPGRATWYATTCGECPAGCGIIVRSINGRPRKIEGNPAHPLNRGKLCARGQAALQRLYDPDRLQGPVRRVGHPSSRSFQPVRWEHALNEVLIAIQRADPPGQVGFIAGMIPDHLHFLIEKFLRSLGADPPLIFDLHSQVEGRRDLHAASSRWFGRQDLPYYDIGRTEVIFSFGANLLETWLSPVAQSVDFARMRKGEFGGRGLMVHFEPRLSSTAATADQWVPVRPGTEGLIALALGRIIVEENLGRVGSHRDHAHLYRGVSVGDIANTTGVSSEELQRLARAFAEVDRSVAIPGGNLSGLSNSQESIDAVMALNVILRRVGRVGGVFMPQTSPTEHLDEANRPDSHLEILKFIEKIRWNQIDVLFLHSTNPIFELPKWSNFQSLLSKIPMIVSFSPTVDDTSAMAHLILPDHTPLESWGYRIPSPSADRPTVSGWQPVVAPLNETRATADILLDLAKRLGGNSADALAWSDEMAFLEEVSNSMFDSSIGRYDARTEAGFTSRWRQYGGWWSEQPIIEEPETVQLPTEALSIATPIYLGQREDYPLHLKIYPSITLAAGSGAQQPLLQEVADPMTTARWQSWIEINPQTAADYGIREHELVLVRSSFGELEVPAILYPGIRPDVVAIPLGRGQIDGGRFASQRGVNPVALLAPAPNNRRDQFLWSSTRVQLEPTGRIAKVARLESLEGEGRESIR